jgi:RimJ/RimL family protein N-acetyltransferase
MMSQRKDGGAICSQPMGEGEITFRLLTAAQLPMLHGWLARPHVAEWWGEQETLEELTRDYAPCMVPGARDQAYIAMLGDGPIGFIQSYTVMNSGAGWWEEETDPGARGIDQFLAEESQLGRGLGTRMVRAFIERLFADPAVTKVQTDPDPRNARAIRCYEKAGFRRVREVDTPDGKALLMTIRSSR